MVSTPLRPDTGTVSPLHFLNPFALYLFVETYKHSFEPARKSLLISIIFICERISRLFGHASTSSFQTSSAPMKHTR